MLSICRGLLAAILVIGLVAVCGVSTDVAAQDLKDKKDEKKDPKKDPKDDPKDRLQGIATSDGLTLSGYWYQGIGLEKQRPDAVIMIPSPPSSSNPDSKVTDAWIGLAKALSEKNFSVLLLDWRGVGMNGIAGQGSRILEDKDKFWREIYNGSMLKTSMKTIEDKGLDWRQLMNVSKGAVRYREFMFNDLLAARFFLDKQNDAGKCNTNRVWLISEKDGAHMAMGFIAAEFQRNTIYDPKRNTFDIGTQFKPAGKDYAGIMALSFSPSGPMSGTADMVYRNALPSTGANDNVKIAKDHLNSRLAMVLMYNAKESATASRNLAATVQVTGTEAAMKEKFKYLKEFGDPKAPKSVTGIDLIGASDSFGVQAFVVKAMVEISKVQNFGKDPTDREAAKMLQPPRFEIEKFRR